MNHFLHRTALSSILLASMFSTLAQAAPIDEFRLSDVEQNIRDLQTTVREQARQIAELQQQLLTGNRKPAISSGASNVSNPPGEQRWLSLANWQKIKAGMSELQVIELLGTPTQIRLDTQPRTRSLLYALEIGRSGFLTGKVVITAGQTTMVEIPSLK